MQRITQILRWIPSGIGAGVTLHAVWNHAWTQALVMSAVTAGLSLWAKFSDEFMKTLEQAAAQRGATLAQWLLQRADSWALALVSQFPDRYSQSLIYAYRTYRTQGLSIAPLTPDLEKVYVPLRVQASSLHQISAAMIQEVNAPPVSRPNLQIWNFLAAAPALRIAVIGSPGAGKSTLLEHLTLTYARRAQRQQHPKVPRLVPVLLYLREWQTTIVSEPAPSLVQVIEQQIQRQPSDRPLVAPPGWFQDKLARGTCLVMLDGLDEVANASDRQRVGQWVNQQMQAYPRATFILTSRPFGYESVKSHLNQINLVLGVQPLTLAEIEQFIDRWYLENEAKRQARRVDPGVRSTAKQQADDLIHRIKNTPALAAMALNPLLLTMIATVHCYRGTLPGRRVQLYAEICDVLLGRRQAAKGTADALTAAQKQTVLQVLALKGMQRNTREFKRVTACLLIQQRLQTVAGIDADPEQFIRQIETVSGLLVEREQGVYEFAHKSFQEYLAAVQIKEINQEALLARHIDDLWWEETIRLYAAQSDASYLIQSAIDRGTVGALTIAYDCLQEGLRVDPKVRLALEATLEDGLESTDAEIFKLAAEVKLARRLKNLLRIDDTTEIDTGYVTCAEYQLFIDEKRSAGENRHPNNWTDDRFQPGNANEPIVGVQSSDAQEFCDWLTLREGSPGETFLEGESAVFVGQSRFRLPTVVEVEQYPSAQSAIGCWCRDRDKLIVAGIEPAQLQFWTQKLDEHRKEQMPAWGIRIVRERALK
jgi:predicted NACHT family NTPase